MFRLLRIQNFILRTVRPDNPRICKPERTAARFVSVHRKIDVGKTVQRRRLHINRNLLPAFPRKINFLLEPRVRTRILSAHTQFHKRRCIAALRNRIHQNFELPRIRPDERRNPRIQRTVHRMTRKRQPPRFPARIIHLDRKLPLLELIAHLRLHAGRLQSPLPQLNRTRRLARSHCKFRTQRHLLHRKCNRSFRSAEFQINPFEFPFPARIASHLQRIQIVVSARPRFERERYPHLRIRLARKHEFAVLRRSGIQLQTEYGSVVFLRVNALFQLRADRRIQTVRNDHA